MEEENAVMDNKVFAIGLEKKENSNLLLKKCGGILFSQNSESK